MQSALSAVDGLVLRRAQITCVNTDAEGLYELAVTVGQHVVVNASMTGGCTEGCCSVWSLL